MYLSHTSHTNSEVWMLKGWLKEWQQHMGLLKLLIQDKNIMPLHKMPAGRSFQPASFLWFPSPQFFKGEGAGGVPVWLVNTAMLWVWVILHLTLYINRSSWHLFRTASVVVILFDLCFFRKDNYDKCFHHVLLVLWERRKPVIAISFCRQQENLNYVCFGVNCFFGRNQYSL